MSGPNSDQPTRLSYEDQCIQQALVALHTNRADGLCRFCGVRDCEVGKQAVVLLRSAGINPADDPLQEWADGGYAVGPSES